MMLRRVNSIIFSTGDFEVSTGGGLISVGLGMMNDHSDVARGKSRRQCQVVPDEYRVYIYTCVNIEGIILFDHRGAPNRFQMRSTVLRLTSFSIVSIDLGI